MPKQRIFGSDSTKISLNLTGENNEIINNLSSYYGLKTGPVISKIISIIGKIPPSIQSSMASDFDGRIAELIKDLENTKDDFYKKEIKDKIAYYNELLHLLCREKDLNVSNIEDIKNGQKKVALSDGYLLIPSDWIVVNPQSGRDCRFAAIIECRNSIKYDIPHFVYLNNHQYACDYDKAMLNHFRSLCRESWPRFSEIEELSEKNKLVPDPEDPKKFLNADAHLRAPIIGYFDIQEQGPDNHDPPCGAVIVRTKI